MRKKGNYVLPYGRVPTLQHIIRAYYTAHRDEGVNYPELQRFSPHKVEQSVHGGSIAFLMDLQIVERTGYARRRLTAFGFEFGKALERNAEQAGDYWNAAAQRSEFMMDVYRHIEGAGYIPLSSLQNYIVRKAGRAYDKGPLAQATTLINIMVVAKMVAQQKVGKEFRISVPKSKQQYVNNAVIYELEALRHARYDLSLLIEMCKAINVCQGAGFYVVTGFLIRAILDHVPPIFGHGSFDQVVGQYGGSSFKKSMRRLNESGRDAYNMDIHGPISTDRRLLDPKKIEVDIELNELLKEIIKMQRAAAQMPPDRSNPSNR